MALSQSPPPLFQQGLPARLRLLIAVVAAVAMIYVDLNLGMLKPLRQGLTVVLYPIEQLLMLPRDVFEGTMRYGSILLDVASRQANIEKTEAEEADRLLALDRLRVENDNLRSLLELRHSMKSKTLVAEISHATRDAFSDRVVIDRGSQHGIALGHPVVNAQGVVGQVVRVSPITAEVALVTDPALAIPVNLPRSSIRTIAMGAGDGQRVVLKYLNINAEVEVDDVIMTSGLDGLYPSGIPVAKVHRVDRAGGGEFAVVSATPVAPVGTLRHVMVMLVEHDLIPPAPRDLDRPPSSKSSISKGGAIK